MLPTVFCQFLIKKMMMMMMPAIAQAMDLSRYPNMHVLLSHYCSSSSSCVACTTGGE